MCIEKNVLNILIKNTRSRSYRFFPKDDVFVMAKKKTSRAQIGEGYRLFPNWVKGHFKNFYRNGVKGIEALRVFVSTTSRDHKRIIRANQDLNKHRTFVNLAETEAVNILKAALRKGRSG